MFVLAALWRSTMFTYTFFQNGFIFISAVAGVVCLCHRLVCSTSTCKNTFLVSAVISTGLCHVIACAFNLDMFQNSITDQLPRGGSPQCVDLAVTATLANAVVLAVISHNVIRRNFSSSPVSWFLECALFLCVLTGTMKTYISGEDPDRSNLQSDVNFMSIRDTVEGSQTDVFLTQCQRKVTSDVTHLIVEYSLVYCPVLVAVLAGMYKSCAGEKRWSVLNLKITQNGCSDEDGLSCVCSKLNPAFVSMLVYSFLLLFVGRPAMIVYSYMTSDVFRDVLPGLTNTVIYCFLCGEYLLRLFKKKRSNRLNHNPEKLTNKRDLRVVQYV